MPYTATVSFGPNGEITAAENNFGVDANGAVTLNGIVASGDFIPINADMRWQGAVGPVLTAPGGGLHRVKVDDLGNIGTEPAS